MKRSKQQLINTFINSLEEMIDARDDMWEEEQHHNYRQQVKIHDERYIPAKEEVRLALHELIGDDSIKE
jgi:hypothetical protein